MKFKLFMAEDKGDQGGGGGDPLFDDKSKGAGGDADPKKTNGTGGDAIKFPDNWKDALPEDIRKAPWLANVKDVVTLAKNHANAQKMIGADKIPVPGKEASKADWDVVFQKLGLPKTLEEYKFELEQGVEVDKTFLDKFKDAAHKAGVLPGQAKQIAEFFGRINKEEYEAQVSEQTGKIQEEMKKLQTEWGHAYQDKVNKAKSVIMEFADDGMRETLKKSGLGVNPTFLKLMANIGETMGEDTLRGGGDGGNPRLSPSEAKSQADAIIGNIKHPYHDPKHEHHADAKRKVREYLAMAYPTSRARVDSIF